MRKPHVTEGVFNRVRLRGWKRGRFSQNMPKFVSHIPDLGAIPPLKEAVVAGSLEPVAGRNPDVRRDRSRRIPAPAYSAVVRLRWTPAAKAERSHGLPEQGAGGMGGENIEY